MDAWIIGGLLFVAVLIGAWRVHRYFAEID
jgi:hypothetical protein